MRETPLYRLKLSSQLPWIAPLFVALATMGCGESTHPDSREMYYFTVVESRTPEPTKFADERPTMNADQIKAYQPIVDAFKKSGPERLKEPDVQNHLERLEQIFISTGDYLDLVQLYEQDFKAHGYDAQSTDRLAFAYVRLGQKKRSRDMIDELMKNRPSAMSHFLDGSFWVRQTPRTAESMKATYLAWSRVVAMDPKFRGFEGINGKVLRDELAAYRQRLPEDLLKEIDEILRKEKETALKPTETAIDPTDPVKTPEGKDALVEKPVEQPAENPDDKQKPSENEEPPTKTTPEFPPSKQVVEQPKFDTEQSYLIDCARGELALSEGRIRDAEVLFIKAQETKPDGIAAEFGQIRAAWNVESARNKLLPRVRALEEKTLTPQQAYDIGLFVASRMTNLQLAKKFWKKAESDEAFSKRVNLKKLLAQ